MNKKKLLLTGASGLLGSNLIYFLKDRYEITAVSFNREISVKGVLCKTVDLRDESAVRVLINSQVPDIIVNAAAMANVDYCEMHPQEAIEANVKVTVNIVKALEGTSIKLIHISTDLVYGGNKGNYQETDATCAINVYADTKIKAEEEALKHFNTLVLRTNFFGFNTIEKRSLAEWGISQLIAGNRIDGFKDVIFSSIYSGDFADLLVLILDKDLKGVYNVGSSSAMSKFEFLLLIGEYMGLDTKNIFPSLVESKIFPAKRAKDLSLNVEKLARDLDCTIPTLPKSLSRFVRDYKSDQYAHMVNSVALKGEI